MLGVSNKIVIVLQDIVTFRASWQDILDNSKNVKAYLVTGILGSENLSPKNKCAFFDHVVCDNFDFYNVKKACFSILEKEKVTNLEQVRIVTNDEYYLGLASDIRESLGICGISKEQITPFTNKISMKEVVSKSEIRIPKIIRFNPLDLKSNFEGYIQYIENKLDYPIFAKQVDSAGSENVAKIINHTSLVEWCLENKERDNYELDEFIEGDLYHIDCLVKNGEVIEQIICKNACPNADFLDGKPMGSMQITDFDRLYTKLSNANKNILDSFDVLPAGALHIEVFVTNSDEVVFLEIAARAPGGWIPQMHKITRGYNIEEQHFLLQMDEFDHLKVNSSAQSAWIWFPQKEGKKVKKIALPICNSKIYIVWDLENGVIQNKPVSIRDKVCGVLLKNDSHNNLLSDYQSLLENFYPYEEIINQ